MATYYTNKSPRFSGSTADCYVVGYDVSYASAVGGKADVTVKAWIYCTWSAYNSSGQRSYPYYAYNQDYIVTIDGEEGSGSYTNKVASPQYGSDWSPGTYTGCNGLTCRQRAYLGAVTRTVTYAQGTAPSITIRVKYNVRNGYSHSWPPKNTFEGSTTLTLPRQTPLTIGSASISADRDTASYSCTVSSAGTGATVSSYYWEIDAETQAFKALDYVKVKNYLENNGTLTDEEIDKYDINRNGYIDADDMWSIRYNASGFQETAASGTIYYFLPNTKYNWTLTVTNSLGNTATKSGSFTTSGNYPTITSVNVSSDRESITVIPTAKFDYGDALSSYSFSYGTSADSLVRGPSTGIKTGLTPNTIYYYEIAVNSVKGKQSTSWKGQVKTLCNKPSALTITRQSGTTTSLVIGLGATGDTNAPITSYTLVYEDPNGVKKTINTTSTSTTIPGLAIDTNYKFYLTAVNAGGSTSTPADKPVIFSTELNNPTISKVEATNILPFSCTITATASINPSRTLSYAFSKDGTNYTAYQSSNVYNWTGLSEETTYTMYVKVKATHTGVNSSDTTAIRSIAITTPADQAKVRIRKSGTWKKGKLWYKKGGTWKKAKKVYIKKDGKWVVGYNYEN